MVTRCFTFGSSHAHPLGTFVKITAETAEACRAEMMRRYGPKWAFDYSESQIEDQKKRFPLREVESEEWRVFRINDKLRVVQVVGQVEKDYLGRLMLFLDYTSPLGFASVSPVDSNEIVHLHPESMVKVRRLTCCCCGDFAGYWKQHYNRDDGFGVCKRCAEDIRKHRPFGHDPMPEKDFVSTYGVEGVNWGAQ